MQIGIVGLPLSGKTTVFNALTRGHAIVAGYSDKPNIGVAKVPDHRLHELAKIYSPERVVPAEVSYVDIPSPQDGFGQTRGISGDYLNALQSTDALLVITRAFDNPSVTHVDESVDAIRDVENMLLELSFSDLSLLERRLDRVVDAFKSAKAAERSELTKEQALLEHVKGNLEAGVAVRDQNLPPEASHRLSGFQFLTAKPTIVVVNISEDQLPEAGSFQNQLAEIATGPQMRATVIAGKLEMDLAQMEEGDEKEFRHSLNAGESGLNRMIALSYDVVGLISFLTVGEDEVRAWQIIDGTIAHKAAGKIHTDLERGFIRAEVVTYENLMDCGSLAEARSRGVLQQEGKEYIVNDGDIMHVLFNV